MDNILTDDFFKDLALSYKGDGCILHHFASDTDYFKPKINQLRRMWKSLPKHIKEDSRIYNAIHSNKDGPFRGGVSELISAWVLNKYFDEFSSKFSVGEKTPDFIARNNDYSYIFETYSLGKNYEEIQFGRIMEKLYKELENAKSRYSVFIEGTPIANADGDFKGLKDKLLLYLENFETPYPDEVHQVSHNGASISFSTSKNPEDATVTAGWFGSARGITNVEKMKKKFVEKKAKYFYPHTQICVADSVLHISKDRIVQALIGDLAVQFSRNKKDVTTTNTQDSLWGINNPDLAQNLHVQGVLFIAQRHNDSTEFQLEISLAENIHLKSGLGVVFHDVPNVFDQEQEYKPLILKP